MYAYSHLVTTQIKRQSLSSTSESSSAPILCQNCSPSWSPLSYKVIAILTAVIFNLFLSVLQLNVIKEYVLFWGLASLAQYYVWDTFLEVTCSCTVSIIVFHCMNILQFSYPVFYPDGLLGCFQFLAIRNKLLEYFCACLFGGILQIKVLDHRVDVWLLKWPKWLSKVITFEIHISSLHLCIWHIYVCTYSPGCHVKWFYYRFFLVRETHWKVLIRGKDSYSLALPSF